MAGGAGVVRERKVRIPGERFLFVKDGEVFLGGTCNPCGRNR